MEELDREELIAFARTIVRAPAYAAAIADVVIASDYARSMDEAKRLVIAVEEAISGTQWHTLLS